MRIDKNKIKKGDVFSELSTYLVENVNKDSVTFKHLETNKSVNINNNYIEDCLTSAEQYTETIYVGKENKYHTEKTVKEAINSGKFKNEEELPIVGQVRLKGLRELFVEIPYKHVFTAIFRKQGKELSAKQLSAARSKQVLELLSKIEEVQKMKKGVLGAAKDALLELQNNVIESYVPGDLRTITAYKTKQQSSTGHYIVKDLKFPDGEDGDNNRLLNINTLEELIVDGRRYILEQ